MPGHMSDDEESEVPEAEAVKSPRVLNRYKQIVSAIFNKYWRKGLTEFEFQREDISRASVDLGIKPPKNLGDVVYTFRYRRPLPAEILATQPSDRGWLILGAGDAKYRFRLNRLTHIDPMPGMMVRKIPDATPEIIAQYALNDEQALLARVRYNRLVDIFLGITAASLQNHLRTKIANYGQIEIDELYVGVDARGVQYIVPVQAKGGSDRLGVIQTIQDVTFCQTNKRYQHCIPRPVSCQFMPEFDGDTVIAMFELNFDGDEVSIVQQRHYRLTAAKKITGVDLSRYGNEQNA
jgi:hypothetical protein